MILYLNFHDNHHALYTYEKLFIHKYRTRSVRELCNNNCETRKRKILLCLFNTLNFNKLLFIRNIHITSKAFYLSH